MGQIPELGVWPRLKRARLLELIDQPLILTKSLYYRLQIGTLLGQLGYPLVIIGVLSHLLLEGFVALLNSR